MAPIRRSRQGTDSWARQAVWAEGRTGLSVALETEPIAGDLSFPEGPRPFGAGILFSDFYRHEVLCVDSGGALRVVCRVENQPSGLGFQPNGDLWIVSMLDRKLLRLAASDLESGAEEPTLEEVADLSALAPSHCNDMVVDGWGRAYVGNFGFDRHRGEAPRTTTLIRVDPGGRSAVVADDLAFPNGTVVTADGTTLIVAESRANRLTAFRLEGNGELADRRLWADLGEIVPDGICLDAEGAIWVADPRRGGVHRVHEGGRVSQVIATPDRNAYACMLAGEERRTLFVCTAKSSGPEAARMRSGRIEVAEVEAGGVGWP